MLGWEIGTKITVSSICSCDAVSQLQTLCQKNNIAGRKTIKTHSGKEEEPSGINAYEVSEVINKGCG